MTPEDSAEWDMVPLPGPGDALAYWHAGAWPAVIAAANCDGRLLPPGSRWATCRHCTVAPEDPACRGCRLELVDGETHVTGWLAGRPSPAVVTARAILVKSLRRARRP